MSSTGTWQKSNWLNKQQTIIISDTEACAITAMDYDIEEDMLYTGDTCGKIKAFFFFCPLFHLSIADCKVPSSDSNHDALLVLVYLRNSFFNILRQYLIGKREESKQSCVRALHSRVRALWWLSWAGWRLSTSSPLLRFLTLPLPFPFSPIHRFQFHSIYSPITKSCTRIHPKHVFSTSTKSNQHLELSIHCLSSSIWFVCPSFNFHPDHTKVFDTSMLPKSLNQSLCPLPIHTKFWFINRWLES